MFGYCDTKYFYLWLTLDVGQRRWIWNLLFTLSVFEDDLHWLLSIEILSTAAQLYVQVSQCRWQTHATRCITANRKIVNSNATITTSLLLEICHPVARIDIAYLAQNLMTLGLAVQWYDLSPRNILKVTWLLLFLETFMIFTFFTIVSAFSSRNILGQSDPFWHIHWL